MPERQSHNSKRRHSSLKCLVSNQLSVHGGARQGFAEPGEERGRKKGEGMAGALPQFPWVRTEKRGVIRGAFWGWIACGVPDGGGVPCGSGHHAPMDHTPRDHERDHPSSFQLPNPTWLWGAGWLGAGSQTSLMTTNGKQNLSFPCAKTHPAAHPLILVPTPVVSQTSTNWHSCTVFFLKGEEVYHFKK